ncbi:MAG: hypothetical protein U0793_22835 [Gemmataceae bacterium]
MSPALAPTAPLSLPDVDFARLAQRTPAERAKGIEQAAAGIEGVFVSLLLKQMRESLEPGAMFGGDSGDVLGGLFDMTLGQHLGKTGMLGIGNLLKKDWMRKYENNQARDAVKKPTPL